MTIPQNSANLVKNYPGIIVRQRHTARKQMELLKKQVRRIKEGTSAVLLHPGLDEKWWADSMECYCYLRNIQDLLSDGKTPCERLVAIPFDGPVIFFGATVEYHPVSAKDLSKLHPFNPKVLPGMFLGHALHAEGVWEGDILVADIEELEQMDASEIHARRLNAKEVLPPMRGENFIFPVADATVNISGGHLGLRTSTLIRDNPDRGEEHDILRGESEVSSSTVRQDSSWYDGEAKMISRRSQENSFIAIMWNPESNCTCRKKNHFLFN